MPNLCITEKKALLFVSVSGKIFKPPSVKFHYLIREK